ncbi:class D beta-lactamase OXA-837 [Cupriavidus gilardii]|uniref:Class D beta-lactamase OXA-837 n=1 Tax=Cupriavidus gilardii TaxID=82541 RepID=A0A5B9DV56_9BURK|nr:class D beta-lactamase OXA-837 [Cupriavidus gilardii]KAA0178957.1 class D beta-lactamase OXA-837 [Cupriavidus gilardii]QEE23059.1 class D beta-lactamase OXA-837 [Cupriavidus gilardii]
MKSRTEAQSLHAHGLYRRRLLQLAGGAALLPAARLALADVAPASAVAAPSEVARGDLMSHFRALDVDGCFALFDVKANRMTLVNASRAKTRMVPASTYKIPNSLIAFETGVVADPDQIQPYGGGKTRFPQWQRDMNLREAIAMSNVPVYQGIARRIGMQRMQTWVDRLDYGNRQLGKVVDQFWLRGPLAISAAEQTRFLARLAQGQLPASRLSQQWVREILRVEANDDHAIYAKTGWAMDAGLNHGWWVGWVERSGGVHAFALNMDLQREELAPKRMAIARAMMAELGVLPVENGQARKMS